MLVRYKWIFKYKYGNLETYQQKFKAKLVARGFT